MAIATPLFLHLSLFLFFFSTSVPAQSQEQQLLLRLKSYWNNHTSLSSWSSSTSTPHCSWAGVTCSSSSVTNITLPDQFISGDIPSFICDLLNLSVLDLFNNSIGNLFSDTVTALSGCTNLTHLNIGYNVLVGPIPETIGSILSPKLEFLDVSGNNLSGSIPKSISGLKNLKTLHLENNLFNGSFPAEIGSLTFLEVLTLAYNPFVSQSIPVEFGNLTKLRMLWMSGMNLKGEIPLSFGNLTDLYWLDLSRNGITGKIPAVIWSLKNLTNIYLFRNNLTGELPATIGATGLVEIDVSMNQLTGRIPEDFGKLEKLQILFLYTNQFTGEIPAGIGNITTLYDIRLFQNRLTGTIPPDLGRYSKLWNLEVWENQLAGELPRDLCKARYLNSLIAGSNNLNGTVPDSLGNCSSLVNIQLHENDISGEFPASIWSLMDLSVVILHDNNLSGELPATLPWNFTRLDVTNNRFSGLIPSRASGLKVFHGSGNGFSGELPANMDGISLIQELLLDGNKLSGVIPSSIGSLKVLTNLDLGRNQLTGEIPAAIGFLPVLTYLDLSSNHLSGNIPDSIGNLKLNTLNLSSNSLTGEVPLPLQNAAYDQSFLSNSGLCSSNPGVVNLPSCVASGSRSSELSKGSVVLFLVLGLVIFLAAVVFGIIALRDFRRRNTGDDLSNWKFTIFQSLDFTETNIVGGLIPENLIGSGGSGQVYRIPFSNLNDEAVAVKKIWNSKRQDSKLEKEFHAEVEILGAIRHVNIVKLLCCISSLDTKLLVYEYMENGSLDQWLHGKRRGSMSSGRRTAGIDWPRRMSIAVGAARGLCYLHHDCCPPIVHRDMKSSNILLDMEFVPKVADFGVARILVNSGEPESVSTLAGSFGYMAPECGYSKKVNEKLDVYSFGVVLLELTTGKQASDGGKNSCLAEWAWQHFQDGGLMTDIVDDQIRNPMWLDEIGMVMKLALVCTTTLPSTRPTMKDVLQVLLKCSGEHKFGRQCTSIADKNGLEYTSNGNGSLEKKGSRRKRPVLDDDDDNTGLLCDVLTKL